MRDLTERQFLKGTARSFWEKQIDDDSFDGDPAAIPDIVLPTDVVQSDGVNEGVDESGCSTPPLLHGDTL